MDCVGNSGMGTSLSKAEQAYLYIIEKLQGSPNFGKTLFYKTLYFSDFDNYELREQSITGGEYRKIENGPAPCSFDKTISSLKCKEFVAEKRISRNGMMQIRYVLCSEASFDKLSEEEKKVLDRNIRRLSGMTATQVSEYSHQDMPYKATKDGEIIDYGLVFYRNPVFSAKDAV